MRLLTTMPEEAEANTLGDALYADGVATTINTIVVILDIVLRHLCLTAKFK